MISDFWDSMGDSPSPWWAPGIPKGKFWLPPITALLDKDPGCVADFRVPREHLPEGHGPAMVWLTTDGVDRRHLTLSILDGDTPLFQCLASNIPQGYVAVPGLRFSGDGHPLEGDALVAQVAYHGPLVPGAKALARPTVLLRRTT